jgi:serine/threonine protein kinase
LNREVALKLIASDIAKNPDRLARFEREARAASALNHPAIVTIYDVGSADSQPWISMELIAGKTLRVLLEAPSRNWLRYSSQLVTRFQLPFWSTK